MNEFVETSVFRRIRDTIDLAVGMGENAAIIGSPGVGKTTALNAYVSNEVHIARLTITRTISRSMRELLDNLWRAFGFDPCTYKSIYDLDRVIRNYQLSDWIIVIDEAQNLKLDQLRELLTFSPTDGGQLRFVFCGNEDVLKQVNTDRGALAQISRRIKYRDTIEVIDDTDSDALTNSFGVEGLDAYEAMRAIGRSFHADGVVDVLKLARRYAERATIKRQHILDALDVLPQYRSALEAQRRRRKGG